MTWFLSLIHYLSNSQIGSNKTSKNNFHFIYILCSDILFFGSHQINLIFIHKYTFLYNIRYFKSNIATIVLN